MAVRRFCCSLSSPGRRHWGSGDYFQLCDPLYVSLFRNGKPYRYTSEDQNLRERRAVAFIVVKQLTFRPLPLWMVKLFEWCHSVHLVTSATLCIAFLGYSVNWTLASFFFVTDVVLWSPFQRRCLNEVMTLNWMHTLFSVGSSLIPKRITKQKCLNDSVGHFYSLFNDCNWRDIFS